MDTVRVPPMEALRESLQHIYLADTGEPGTVSGIGSTHLGGHAGPGKWWWCRTPSEGPTWTDLFDGGAAERQARVRAIQAETSRTTALVLWALAAWRLPRDVLGIILYWVHFG
jgi:hypothetical protein